MRLLFTKNFVRNYRKLPQETQKAVDIQLELLLTNAQYASLAIKKTNDPRNIWEARVALTHRLTFQIEGDIYILRKVGSHDILKKP